MSRSPSSRSASGSSPGAGSSSIAWRPSAWSSSGSWSRSRSSARSSIRTTRCSSRMPSGRAAIRRRWPTCSAPTTSAGMSSRWSSTGPGSRSRSASSRCSSRASSGVLVGAVAGYVGGVIDNVLMRVVDVFFAIPFLFVILVAARFFGQGQLSSLILIFGLLSWPLIARLVRAMFLTLREADFVEAARAVGVSDIRITFRHILPNALGPVIVAMTLIMASNIVLEAFVSYLGFGAQRGPDELGQRPLECPDRPQPGQLVVGLLPGHGDRPDRAGDQLHRGRPARRARSAVAAVTDDLAGRSGPPPDDVLLEVRGLQDPLPGHSTARSRRSTASTSASSAARPSAWSANRAAARA